MDNSLVSILIPVYNRGFLIKETIHCAVKQTYSNLEIIISDNCSTDGTWSILQEYSLLDKRIKIFQNKENIGPVRNWEEGLKRCSGEYVKILWSDDLMSDDFIEKTMHVFDSHTGFVMSGIEYFGDSKEFSKFQSYYSSKVSSDKYLEQNILNSKGSEFPLSPGCAIFRKVDLVSSLLIDIPNDFNLDFSKYGAGNDLLMFLLIAKKYDHIKIIPEFLSKFRVHNGSFSVENNLEKYYNLAKWYFVQNDSKRLRSLFSTNIYFKRKSSLLYQELWLLVREDFDISNLILYRISRLIFNLKSRCNLDH
jgi:glycosyltransferase involved in cell wall biosynthesis